MKTSRSRKSISITGHAVSFPVLADEASLSTLRTPTGLLSRAWGWIQARQVARSSTKRLRVAETVSLGEKRFVAVVQVDGRHFLLAGGPTNIALLAQLDAEEDFENVLKKTMTSRKQPAKRRQEAPAVEPANIAPRTQLNNEAFADVLKKTIAPSKQPAKRTRKKNALPAVPTEAALRAQSNGTEAFGDVLKRTMTVRSKEPSKQSVRQNAKPTIKRPGVYA